MKVAVVGLGYVGLPLAVEFGKKYPTVGFDLSREKIDAYRRHIDPTGEVSAEELKASTHLEPTTDAAALKEADFVVVAVPTPVDDAHAPDFSPLVGALILAMGSGDPVTTIDTFTPRWDAPHGNRCPTERSLDTARALWEQFGVIDRITAIEGDVTDPSLAEVAPELGFLFVDADHTTASLRQQIALWAPKVEIGGRLVLHDWGIAGNEAEPWDVAGVLTAWTEEHGGADCWRGPEVYQTLAWYDRVGLHVTDESEG